MTDFAILIPLKDFSLAKERLRVAGIRDAGELAKNLALGVIVASAPRTVIVVAESDEVSSFARENDVEVFRSNATGLNEAASLAYKALGSRFAQLMFVHGDLARPHGLGTFEPEPGVTIVTDRHGRGTNVLVVPTELDFQFFYGTDSRTKHEGEAERLAQPWRVIASSPWSLDIDEPGDLELGF